MMRHSNPTAGFSMTEMMMVLVIMGIAMAAAVPNVTRYMRHDQVRMAAENFKAACAITQQRAISTRLLHRVIFDPDEDHYYVERRESGSWTFAAADTTWLDEGVEIRGGTDDDASNTTLTYEAQGTIDRDEVPATITFSNSHGDSSVVRVLRTGRMAIQHH